MKFRKKPVVIEAFQMTPYRHDDNGEWPVWLHEAWEKDWEEPGSLDLSGFTQDGFHTYKIKTLEGEHVVSLYDWIIKGVQGELYPCKPDIFEATYEAVDD